MCGSTILVGGCATLVAALVFSQEKVSLAGRWLGDREKNAPAIAAGVLSPMPQEMTITQSAGVVTITRPGANGGTTAKYNLDGSESKNLQGQREVVSKATWDGARLIIVTTQPIGETTAVYTLDGAYLKIETTLRGSGSASGRTWAVFFKRGD